MKAFTPEISWHNRLPALALDISHSPDDKLGNCVYRIATGGNDCRVYIWLVDLSGRSSDKPDIKIRAGLRRHQKSVGAVRFSPNSSMLASGDDDGYIYLWRHKIAEEEENSETSNNRSSNQQSNFESNTFLNDDGFEDLEIWQQYRVLRGHIEDICDLTWSKDGLFLLSGSIDNSAILWDTTKCTKVWCSDLIKGYVQGVALDPHSQYMAAISSDRTLRIYNFSDKRLMNATRRMNIKSGQFKAFFGDDTVQTFCRRFEFSPDGQFLLAPTGRLLEKDQTKATNIFLTFKRSSFSKPILYYPTGREVALCIRFSPVIYKLRETKHDVENNNDDDSDIIEITEANDENQNNGQFKMNEIGNGDSIKNGNSDNGRIKNFWNIPYRMVFAVATSRSILIYDSQQSTPIGYASQIHLARLTDLAWSSDGRLLMITSYDGYSTLLTFDKNEFGERYTGEVYSPIVEQQKKEMEIELQRQQELELQRQKQQELEEQELKKKQPVITMWKYLTKKSG